jgi:hypothetical protein
MKPKSREEILNTFQNNFWNYTTLSKIFIIISILLSASSVVYYLCGHVFPTIQGIINGDITGWFVLWKIFIVYILYYVLRIVNLVFVCIGGSAICREEQWESIDFAKAWVNLYQYEKYLNEINDEKYEE